MNKRMCVQFILIASLASGLVFCGCQTTPRPTRDRITITTNCYWLPGAKVPQRVAVLDFEGPVGPASALTDFMVLNLIEGGFSVLERDHLGTILGELQIAEQGFQDLSDVQKAQKLGQILNAEAIVTGKLLQLVAPDARKGASDSDLAYLSANSELAARAIDVQTGEILWMSTISVNTQAKQGKALRYMDFIDEACKELVYSLSNPNYQNRQNAIYEKEDGIQRLRQSRQM